jgi:hypothetical protein
MSVTKSQRKFRFWDNRLLFQNLERVLQFKDEIENVAITNNLSVEELPQSIVPTATFYEMLVCYEAMYDKLLDEELITHGYPKSTTTHH